MSISKIVVRGTKRADLAEESITEGSFTLPLRESYSISSSRATADTHAVNISKNDLLEFVFDDNTSWHCNADDLHDLFPDASARSVTEGIDFEIPYSFNAGNEQRGTVSTIVVKALNIFAKDAIKAGVHEIAEYLESKQMNNFSGLFQLKSSFELAPFRAKESGNPYLLFIHGTGSSTDGSFGELRGSDMWEQIVQTYGEHILAFNHETLTKSPIQNVSELLKQLPDAVELHLISHSRGGLLGEIISRCSNTTEAFTDAEIECLRTGGHDKDIEYIEAIHALLATKKIKVSKFIRVACPARGTTLLSKRMDYFINVLMNLTGVATGAAATPVYQGFKALIASVVDTKNDFKALPGIEAMHPDSVFLKVLNNRSHPIETQLLVIAGNCGVKISLKALLVIVTKLFYLRDNDLIVDTQSMYLGTLRKNDIQYFFDEGGEVDHFHYFKNKKTREAMMLALRTREAVIPSFTSMHPDAGMSLNRNAVPGLDGGEVNYYKVSGNKPVLILLPGIMGSNLADKKDNVIWVNYLRFLMGDIGKIDITENGVKAKSLVKSSYKKIADYFSGDYDVITFAYDWRLSLSEAAAQLNSKIQELLPLNKPIKIMGHSMGGVVVRDFIINHRNTWNQVSQTEGFRLVFLGSPLKGSYRIPYVLSGRDGLIQKIATIDLKHSKAQLLSMFNQFPGLLCLLPIDTDPHDLADPEVWKKIADASDYKFPVPQTADLKGFDAYRKKALDFMNNEQDILENAVYVAGRDKETINSFEIDPNQPNDKLAFYATQEGDQSVTWASGIPKVLLDKGRVYYTEVTHANLANEPNMFAGLKEILLMGETKLLSRNRPVIRGAEKKQKASTPETFDVSPEGTFNSIFGITTRVDKKVSQIPIKMNVSHGDLRYSSFPLFAGHFEGDGILSAEAVMDKYLNYTIKERYQLGLYPGALGTHEILLNQSSDFKGAVITGLGKAGELTPGQLTFTLEQAMLQYMLKVRGSKLDTSGISALLIGCGYGGLTIESSLRAIITAVQNANQKVAMMNIDSVSPISRIELVELYEDRALQCVKILDNLENDTSNTLNISLDRKIKTLFGQKKRIPMEVQSSWWQRITVVLSDAGTTSKDKEDNALRTLRFSSSASSAHEKQRDLYSSNAIIDALIEDISTENRWTPQLAKTIFELLIPNDFKDNIRAQNNILWILDKNTAEYPWELLQYSANNAKPLCVNAGMIRQLSTYNYRMKINSVTARKALVIADPQLDGYCNQLRGAREEGILVAGKLKEYGYDTIENINRNTSEVIQSLMQDEYKIIHLAGHGVFNDDITKPSGMLIGKNRFLSTREISQMSTVPEFVFVNCCFLGKADGEAEQLFRDRYKLAANIGTQLIENGVKAVIAAGWAVDDAAAKRFTEVFYDKMFHGYEFSEAVKEARNTAFNEYPANNTWGAYQCYGDPFYKFADTTRKVNGNPYSYIISNEAEIDLDNILNRIDTSIYDNKQLLEQTRYIDEAVEKAGIGNARITEKKAMILSRLYQYEEAIDTFESLFKMEKAEFSIVALEKYCNVKAKQCVLDFDKQKEERKGKGKASNEAIDKLCNVIHLLMQLRELGETAERYSLLGSAYKRKAYMQTTKAEKQASLKEAAYFYYQANNIKGNKYTAYTLCNWLELEALLADGKTHKWGEMLSNKKYKLPKLADAELKLKAFIPDGKATAKSGTDDLDFWNLIEEANATLALWILKVSGGTKTYKEIGPQQVINAYNLVWSMAGSMDKKRAEIEHFEILIDAAETFKPAQKELIQTLKKIKTSLQAMIK